MKSRASFFPLLVLSLTSTSVALAQTDGGDAGSPPDGAAPGPLPDAAVAPDATVSGPDATTEAGAEGGIPPALACNVNTGFPGDGACILPGPNALWLHFGPRDYDNPDDIAAFTLAPGAEQDSCYFLTAPNTAPVHVDAFQFRSRPGLVSASVYLLAQSRADSTGPEPCGTALDDGATLLLAPQSAQLNLDLTAAPENAGLSWEIPAGAQVAFRTHYINTAGMPSLREAWLNAFIADGATQNLVPIELRGRSGPVPPATASTYTFRCEPATELRIVQLAGIMSASTNRLSAYAVAPDGVRSLLYASYDWYDSPMLSYDSVTTNPNAAEGVAGGVSGVVTLNAGDALEWECEIQNTTDQSLSFEPGSLGARAQCDVLGAAVADQPFRCTSTVDAPDAGTQPGTGGAPTTGGAGGAAPITGGASSSGGSASSTDGGPVGASGGSDDGCSCRIETRSVSGDRAYGLLAALGVIALGVRRTRRTVRIATR